MKKKTHLSPLYISMLKFVLVVLMRKEKGKQRSAVAVAWDL